MAIKFKGSETSGAIPTGLGERELAWQIADKKIFTTDSAGNLVEFSGENYDERVKISQSDSAAGYLGEKLSIGDGLISNTIDPNGDAVLELSSQVWIGSIDNEDIPVFYDSNRNKTLSVETQNVLWSENKLSSTEWVGLSRAVDKLSGWVAPMNCTIVGFTAQTSAAGSSSKPIDLYIDDVNNGTLFSFAGSSSEDYQIDGSIDIDIQSGQKIRLKCGGGPTIQDTIIDIRIRWRV